MDVQITHNDDDITNYVISYERTKEICSGIETFEMEISKNIPYNMIPWDRIKIFEEGSHRSTLRISSRNQSARGTYKLSGQDESKRLTDYFVSDNYFINYPSTARYWIEKFMTEAGVSYVFETASNGALLNKDTNIGLNHAYDIIQLLLQQSGWYMKFDKNRVAHIGELNLSLSDYDETFSDDEILSIDINRSDKLLRNRAVVWGQSDPTTGSWVYADLSVNTPWNYDELDKRAVVLANGYINSTGVAYSLAQQMLNEFTQLLDVVAIEVHGGYDLDIGSVININSNYYKGTGFITTYSARTSKDGLITTIIINERCPRLFGYYGFSGDYVYIGTTDNGIYRKLLEGSSWESFSTGLQSLYVTDLKISGGVFACVAGGELYTRNVSDTSWNLVDPGTFHDDSVNPIVDYISSIVECTGCAINRATNTIYAIYRTIDLSAKRSWAIILSPDGSNTKYLLNNNIDYNAISLDIDTDDVNLYATVRTSLTEVEAISDCTEKFSTLNLTSPSRSYSRSVAGPDGDSNFKGYSTIERCEFKSYFIEVDPNDDTMARVIVIDHSNADTLIVTVGSSFALNGGVLTDLIYYNQGTGVLWFAIDEGSNSVRRWEYQPLYDTYIDKGTTTIPFALTGTRGRFIIRLQGSGISTYIQAYDVEEERSMTSSTADIFTTTLLGQVRSSFTRDWATFCFLSHSGSGTVNYFLYMNAVSLNLESGSSSTVGGETGNAGLIYETHPSTSATPILNGLTSPGIDYSTESIFVSLCSVLVRNNNGGNITDVNVGGAIQYGVSSLVVADSDIFNTNMTNLGVSDTAQLFNKYGYSIAHLSLGNYSIFDTAGSTITTSAGPANTGKSDYNYDFYYTWGVVGGFSSSRTFHLYPNNMGEAPSTSDMSLFAIPAFNNYVYLSNVVAKGHIFSVAYTTHNVNNDSVNSTVRLFEFFDEGGIIPDFKTLQLTSETEPHWTVIDDTTSGHFLEVSQSFPVSTFAYTNDVDNLRINVLPSGFVSPAGDNYRSFISDIRIFDLTPLSSIATASGIVTASGGRYIGVCTDGLVEFIHSDLSGNFTILTTISGSRPRMETSNFFQPPYFFVAASGIFLQQNPNNSAFTDYSFGMPGSTVTVIRVDDKL